MAALREGEVAVWRVDPGGPRPLEFVAARYLDVEPASVTITRSALGRPMLTGSSLAVSLAHSGDAAVVAIADGRDVGVDLERLRPGVDGWSLVRHALTSRERRRLGDLPRAGHAAAFLSAWARKEALLKAAGVGLAVDPARVELDGTSVVAVPPQLGSRDDWTILDFRLPGYLGAVAVRGGVAALRLYDGR